MEQKKLNVGEPAPWFEARSPVNPRFHFDTVAGRTVVLCFFGSAAEPTSRRILDGFLARRDLFDDDSCCFFGVSVDSQDEALARVQEQLPGVHLFWDFDRRVSKLYGVAGAEDSASYEPRTFVLDERLRFVASFPFSDAAEQHVASALDAVAGLPPLKPPHLADVPAPVLVVPRIFEPELCLTLVRYYNERGGEESGFMRQVDGKTVAVHDYGHKRRRDQEIADERLRNACMFRIHDRLVPEIRKAFQFCATRVERYIVACYDSSHGGYFRPHRDNTTKGTAHRRFAVSLNLNTGEYEGGLLRFPEFGRQLYAPPVGGAVVFSCSLLHEATPVTAGCRYAFLPFLYDDDAARIRQQNLQFFSPEAGSS
jgi:peroxiredoxin/predicted 2-oxoglutarate/Fe(II)-dependent dioxygenase YbiX